MRPLRGLIICLSTLLLVTVVLTVRRSQRNHDEPAAARASRSRFRALFSFHTPESLFPPSAIISLTDDNSTFFLARPAAYGSALPSEGLSGQLWIGSGFAEESAGRGGVTINSEGELGCSDIPGWPNVGEPQISESAGKQGGEVVPRNKHSRKAMKRPTQSVNGAQKSGDSGRSGMAPAHNDGTDDYLHWPLKGAPLAIGASIYEKLRDGGTDNKDKEHADIQSIQESAEIAGKVVLLSRGGCGFLEKTKWVQRRGGIALIVGDNIRGGSLITMFANGDIHNVTIPSVFTSHTTAQLLSTLTPHGDLLRGRPLPEIINPIKQPPSGGVRKATHQAKTDENKDAASSTSGSSESWFGKLAGALGSGRSSGSENRKHPNSGKIATDRNRQTEDGSSKKTSEDKQVQDSHAISNVAARPHGQGADGFVIGVHDWRDPDLVALQQEADREARTKTDVLASTSTKSRSSVATNAKAKEFSGGNAVPGSGRYSLPAQGEEKVEDTPSDRESSGWLGGFFAPEIEQLTEEEALGIDLDMSNRPASALKANALPPPPLVDTPEPREGLWVTITPTTMTSSPFFDTLLVLVVSPLVTLTVVYALLILRARIQRRRWRAPKSVVDRLPVRTYHTMSSTSTSTSTSSHAPSADASTANSPLLHPEHTSTLSRTRPRSRTTTSINESPALTLERQREDLASRLEKKPYRGRQVECAVCLEEYIDGQSQIMCLPCGHEFHVDCITPWLTTRRRTCPICKGDVVRSLAASSSAANRSASSSPSRSRGPASRAHSLDRSGTPHSDTPLLGRRGDDVERGSASGLPVRSAWTAVSGAVSRLWDRRRVQDEPLANRDR